MPIATPQGTLDFKSVDKVTFVGASSNTVIDTTTGSLGVGVGVGGPTSNLHVVGNTRLEGDINMLHTANTASIKLNSNVVTEFPRSKKLIKYPRVALTSAAQTGSGYQGYFVSQASATLSSTSDRRTWNFFDDIRQDVAGPHFDGSGARYDSSGNYTGGDSLGGVSGDWAYIRLPDKIQLQSVDLWARYDNIRNPIDATVLGRLNGTNWSVLGSWKNAKFTAGQSSSFNLNSIQYYDYIGFVFEKIEANSSGGYVNFQEIELLGTPEYDPDAHGTDVTVKSVANVPNTDWLEVYYDAKGLNAGAVSTVNDLKPSSLGSAINSSSVTDVSVSNEAFAFNGSSSGINATLSNPQGAWAHSTSVWIKLGKDHSAYNSDNVFSLGNAASTAQLVSLRILANEVKFVTFQGNADATYSLPMDRDRWYHFTLTYDGGAGQNSLRLFRDGIEYTGTATAAPGALSLAANSLLSIGYERVRNYKYFNGSIANFRLFNRALTSDEIYQLYAYQKEDFGHGDLSMTLKAGRLGIGTSEPRAALDVRGDIYAVGSVNPVIGMWKQSISSATVTTNILTNIGSCISITTAYRRSSMSGSHGLFTAPYDGIYQFQAFLIAQSTGSNCLLVFGANGPSVDNNTWNSKNLIDSYNELFELRGNVDLEEPITFATLLNMSKGDTVNIQNHSSGYLGLNDLRCSAFLLHRFN
jgi:hypothetical protein